MYNDESLCICQIAGQGSGSGARVRSGDASGRLAGILNMQSCASAGCAYPLTLCFQDNDDAVSLANRPNPQSGRAASSRVTKRFYSADTNAARLELSVRESSARGCCTLYG